MNELVVFDEVAAIIAKYKVENENLLFDYRDPEGEKQARSHIAQLRKVKTIVSDIHKDAKAEALAFGRRLDAKKTFYNSEVDGMIAVHKDPLDAIEAEKQAVIDAENQKVIEAEAKRVADLEAREAAVRAEEEKQSAEKAKAERIEREKHIADEAAERARIQAEQKAKAVAEAKELAEIRRKEAEEAAEKKRIENKKHRTKVEDEIQYSLTELGFNPDDAYTILTALMENRIPHVSINY